MLALTDLALPVLRALPPEVAHRASLWALKTLPRRAAAADQPVLAVKPWDHVFPNPVGLAAGYDKNAEAIDPLFGFGFGFVEVGTVTPLPQPGNPKPRVFRLSDDGAAINRLGFNSQGLVAVARRLAARDRSRGILGVNIGRNKDTDDPIADYEAGVTALAPYADYLAVNVSSPNTPGLRDMQRKTVLPEFIARLQLARAKATPRRPPPLLLKIAPDLEPQARNEIAEVALFSGLDGLIISNSTVARPASLKSARACETGGLTGKPLFAPSTALLSEMYRLTGGRLPLVGVGGIASGADAYAKIRAGATVVQLYTALVYQGPGLVARIKTDLARLLRRDGFVSVGEAVGTALQ
ncbi:MAG: quinone-dependent dihydroorotate dehydrogenase [Alphaproteobacteria bacterium]|nr:quinone-dependent dihydroorotate dehydrogenase [Alphaproteobacteria bacterium]